MGVLAVGGKTPLPELIDYIGKAIKYGAYKLKDEIAGLRAYLKQNEINVDSMTDEELQAALNLEAKQRGVINAKIFTPQSGEVLKYKIDGGKIILPEGKFTEDFYDFVITESDELVIGSSHFTLSGNADFVKGAGRIYITKTGKINTIDNWSGHYKPDSEQLIQQFKLLQKFNILADDCVPVNMW